MVGFRIGGVILAALGALVAGCSEPVADSIVVPADPDRGFHYPYILSFPEGEPTTAPGFLLVEPNNTGRVSDDPAVHLEAARELARNAIGGHVARALKIPLLVPVFPRPESQWRVYTHLLDRDVMTLRDDPMARPDLQLLAMVDDAVTRLLERGYVADRRILLTGFSASGAFANRFTLLHPHRVRAVASGGVNGLLMLPVPQLAGETLDFPLGIADYAELTGRPFDLAAWREVPQFAYMGAEDENDAVLYDDGYSEAEREIVFAAFGERMQPDRWKSCREVYDESGARARFRTYKGVGHGTNSAVNDEIVRFFASVLADGNPAVPR